MAPARSSVQNLASGRDLETLGNGFSGLDAFGTSHNGSS
jgi:hypothetical protein